MCFFNCLFNEGERAPDATGEFVWIRASRLFCEYCYHHLDLILAPFLTPNGSDSDPSLTLNSQSLNIMELGSGAGLAGLFFAKFFSNSKKISSRQNQNDDEGNSGPVRGDMSGGDGVRITLTDQNESVLELLQHNIRLNALHGLCETRALEWSELKHTNPESKV